MVKKYDSNAQRLRRHKRVRAHISGTAARPRLDVFRSSKHIYAQVIDDATGCTLVAAASNEKDFGIYGGNIEAAKKVGQLVAERAKQAGIENVVFDRGGYLYHGRVQALAESAREAGLKF
ncbi:MAG: 50S ribosomal protein L18 [Clostridium sp. SCN 57-10]|nr:MAG: 50S ribosomal protein L18 [Clostridium sp. SCN 57-10]